MKPLLLNVRYVQAIAARRLMNCTVIPGVGIMLNMWRAWTALPVVGLGEYTIESSLENNGHTYSHTLKAHLEEQFDLSVDHFCYLLTTIDGHRYLIGLNEHPYPITNITLSMPSSETEKSGCTLSVTYTDTLGPMPVLD